PDAAVTVVTAISLVASLSDISGAHRAHRGYPTRRSSDLFVTQNDTAKSITLDETASTFGTLTARTLNTAGAAAVAGTISLYESGDRKITRLKSTREETSNAASNMTKTSTLTVGGHATSLT